MKKEKTNKGKAIEICVGSDNWLWRTIRYYMLKVLKKDDKLGFYWKNRHFIIRKEDFKDEK